MARATVSGMTDIDDAIARGFRVAGPLDDQEEWNDDFDPVPLAPLALEPDQRRSLAHAVEEALRDRGCDNTLGAAEAWARRGNASWDWLHGALAERGGFCDCEVLMNVLE